MPSRNPSAAITIILLHHAVNLPLDQPLAHVPLLDLIPVLFQTLDRHPLSVLHYGTGASRRVRAATAASGAAASSSTTAAVAAGGGGMPSVRGGGCLYLDLDVRHVILDLVPDPRSTASFFLLHAILIFAVAIAVGSPRCPPPTIAIISSGCPTTIVGIGKVLIEQVIHILSRLLEERIVFEHVVELRKRISIMLPTLLLLLLPPAIIPTAKTSPTIAIAVAIATAATAKSALQGAIVLLLRILVGQHLVRLGYLAELNRGGLLVPQIAIGMMPHGQLSVRLLDVKDN